jgi:hypothetical protein
MIRFPSVERISRWFISTVADDKPNTFGATEDFPHLYPGRFRAFEGTSDIRLSVGKGAVCH